MTIEEEARAVRALLRQLRFGLQALGEAGEVADEGAVAGLDLQAHGNERRAFGRLRNPDDALARRLHVLVALDAVAAEHLVVEAAAARRTGLDRVGGRPALRLAGVGDAAVVALAPVVDGEAALAAPARLQLPGQAGEDRKSTRLNSSH